MLMVMVVAASASVAVAQTPRTVSLRIDNDAFDFWMLPWNRPDEEYSSGVHITYDGGDAPWWSRRFLRQSQACTTSSRECRMGRAEIGQDLYTPATSKNNPVPKNSPATGMEVTSIPMTQMTSAIPRPTMNRVGVTH